MDEGMIWGAARPAVNGRAMSKKPGETGSTEGLRLRTEPASPGFAP
jgi:hypothetical protein